MKKLFQNIVKLNEEIQSKLNWNVCIWKRSRSHIKMLVTPIRWDTPCCYTSMHVCIRGFVHNMRILTFQLHGEKFKSWLSEVCICVFLFVQGSCVGNKSQNNRQETIWHQIWILLPKPVCVYIHNTLLVSTSKFHKSSQQK